MSRPRIRALLSSLIGFGLLWLAFPAGAAEGRIPVFAPGTFIAMDGKYIVTRNIAGGAAPVITIAAANVDLDLNGFTLSRPGGGAAVVLVSAPPPVGSGDVVAIRNGFLSGGGLCIDDPGGTKRKLIVEDVTCHDPSTPGTGIHLGDVENASIRRVQIINPEADGILWDGGVTKSGTIENNLVRTVGPGGNGIQIVAGCASLAILHNRIESVTAACGGAPVPPTPFGNGIVIAGCSAALLSENTIENVCAEGIAVRSCRGCKLYDNLVSRAGLNGIHLDPGTSSTLVLNNVSQGNGFLAPPGFDGLLVEGTMNLIDRNVLNMNARYGLHFSGPGSPFGGPAACGNGFGRNLARGNGGPVVACAGAPALFPPNSCNGGTAAACPAAPFGPNSTYGDNLIPGPPIF